MNFAFCDAGYYSLNSHEGKAQPLPAAMSWRGIAREPLVAESARAATAGLAQPALQSIARVRATFQAGRANDLYSFW